MARYEAIARLDVKPGRYTVRAGAYRDRDGESGSVFASIDVPNFGDEPLSLSGVLLAVVPPVASSPANALADLTNLVPTTVRAFRSVQQVDAGVQIYESRRLPMEPINILARIRNTHGTAMLSQVSTVPVDQIDDKSRSASYQLGIPVATLAPGEYLLTIEATSGTSTAQRDVRFLIVSDPH